MHSYAAWPMSHLGRCQRPHLHACAHCACVAAQGAGRPRPHRPGGGFHSLACMLRPAGVHPAACQPQVHNRCMDAWMLGCMDAKMHGCMDACVLACTMQDRLPTLFGLVRSGVAPDHQDTKVRCCARVHSVHTCTMGWWRRGGWLGNFKGMPGARWQGMRPLPSSACSETRVGRPWACRT